MGTMDKVMVNLRMVFKKANNRKMTMVAKTVCADLEPKLVAKIMNSIAWLDLFTKDGIQLCHTPVAAGYRTVTDEELVDSQTFADSTAASPKKVRKPAKPRPFTQDRREKLLKNMETLDHRVLLNAAPINVVTYLTDYYQNARHTQDIGRFLRGVYFLELRELLAGEPLGFDQSELQHLVTQAYEVDQWTSWHQLMLPLLASYFTPEKYAAFTAKSAENHPQENISEKEAQWLAIQEEYATIEASTKEEVQARCPIAKWSLSHTCQMTHGLIDAEAETKPQPVKAPDAPERSQKIFKSTIPSQTSYSPTGGEGTLDEDEADSLIEDKNVNGDSVAAFSKKSQEQANEIQIIYGTDPQLVAKDLSHEIKQAKKVPPANEGKAAKVFIKNGQTVKPRITATYTPQGRKAQRQQELELKKLQKALKKKKKSQ